jgi:hypothetical protein
MVFGFALVACGVAVIIGALSRSFPKAALYSGLALALIAFAGSLTTIILLRSLEAEIPLEAAAIQALAVIPAAMALGVIGRGVRYGLGRLMPKRPNEL